ncbi:MAG: hypothetical protein JWO81_1971 [Alphaproteobacteria bacterium]|nr:hypothetical protein [Alphaproteobacteria bacterium]
MTGQSRVDPRSGTTLVLAPEGLTTLSTDGGRAFIPAPAGYTLSHFAEGAIVVGRGETPVDGWWDWHFEVDPENAALRRLGPAY